MINLNECKFGDRLKTKDGEMVVFLGIEDYHGFDGVCRTKYYCAMAKDESFVLMEYNDGERGENDSLPEIVCRWEDEIENPATPYEIKPDMPKAIKPIKGVSEAMVEQWLQDIKHLK